MIATKIKNLNFKRAIRSLKSNQLELKQITFCIMQCSIIRHNASLFPTVWSTNLTTTWNWLHFSVIFTRLTRTRIRIYHSSSNTGSGDLPRIPSRLLVICKSSHPCSTAIWFTFAQRTDQGVFQLHRYLFKIKERKNRTCVANSPRLTMRDVICIICSLCKINTPVVSSFLNRVILWKWRNDRRSERNLCNCVKKPEKKKNSGLQRGLNPWPRDTGAMLYQLSYEAFRLLYAIA